MADDNSVTIDVLLGLETLNSRLKSMESSFKTFSENSSSFLDGLNVTWSSFVGNLAANAVEEAFNLATEAAKEFYQVFVVDGVEAAKQEQDAIHALNESLELSGNFTRAGAQDFLDYAASIENTTKVSKDAVLQAGALLENLTHLSEDGLKKATSAAVETSVALGIDLDSAASLVGKGIDGNTSAFKRYGIAIQQSADPAENLNNILKALAPLAGTAASQMETFSGATERNKNVFHELQAETGSFITQNPEVIKGVNDLTAEFKEMDHWVATNKEEVIAWVDDGIYYLVEALGYTLIAVDGLGRGFKGMEQLVGVVIDGLTTVILGWATLTMKEFEAVLGWIPKFGPAIQAATAEMTQLTKAAADQTATDAKAMASTFSTQGPLAKAGEQILSYGDKLKTYGQEHDQMLDDQTTHTQQYVNKQKDIFEQLNDFYAANNGERAKNMEDTLKTIANLENTSSGVLFGIGQAAAIATATIDGIQAEQKALASAPPPFNFVLAALVGVAELANIAKIASTPPPTSPAFAEGGVVQGMSYSGDNIMGRLNSREMVLTQQQQAMLWGAIKGGNAGGGGQTVIHIENVNANSQAEVQSMIVKMSRAMRLQGSRLPAAGVR